MLPSKIVVKVIQADIEAAIQGTSYNSPMAKAFRRQFPYLREADVRWDQIVLGVFGACVPWNYIHLHHTAESKAFEQAFDKKQPVKPASFELEVFFISPSWLPLEQIA